MIDRRGFSLIELMVVVGVVGALLGILLPALAAARERTQETRSLANLHNLGLTVAAHSAHHKGFFPFPHKDAGSDSYGPFVWHPSGDRRNRDAVLIYTTNVWSASQWWPALLHDVAPWREHYESWLSPGMRRSGRDAPPWTGASVGYFYSNSFLAKPRVWSGGPASEADIGPVSVDMVAAPSAKVIFFDAVRAYLRRATPHTPRPLLFVDGAAALRLDRDATAPVQNPLHRRAPQRYHDTPLGAKGRDF